VSFLAKFIGKIPAQSLLEGKYVLAPEQRARGQHPYASKAILTPSMHYSSSFFARHEFDATNLRSHSRERIGLRDIEIFPIIIPFRHASSSRGAFATGKRSNHSVT
jgi:hypothetical protein